MLLWRDRNIFAANCKCFSCFLLVLSVFSCLPFSHWSDTVPAKTKKNVILNTEISFCHSSLGTALATKPCECLLQGCCLLSRGWVSMECLCLFPHLQHCVRTAPLELHQPLPCSSLCIPAARAAQKPLLFQMSRWVQAHLPPVLAAASWQPWLAAKARAQLRAEFVTPNLHRAVPVLWGHTASSTASLTEQTQPQFTHSPFSLPPRCPHCHLQLQLLGGEHICAPLAAFSSLCSCSFSFHISSEVQSSRSFHLEIPPLFPRDLPSEFQPDPSCLA